MIIKIALFLLGIYLSGRIIAALYGIIDLWYTIKTAYPKVIRSIVGWSAIAGAVAWLIDTRYCPAFLYGLAAFAIWYVGSFWLTQILINRIRQREKRIEVPG